MSFGSSRSPCPGSRPSVILRLKAGNDIETPKQMRDAILSSGGVPGVNVALCETV